MKLGAFSISLSVKDISASKLFYEKLGFTKFAGDLERKYLIMKSGESLIGLFEGMFEGNILTFNPGWDQNTKTLENYDDVRKIQEHLIKNGIKLSTQTDINGSGPGSLSFADPDNNNILIDQHV